MEKPQVNEDGYLAELNKALQAHPNYRSGMKFLPYPEGSSGSGVMGFTWVPMTEIGVFAEVSNGVMKAVDLVTTQR